jgi:uncharacterized protein YodC (DUF2158 family)
VLYTIYVAVKADTCRTVGTPKMYFTDTGLAAYLCRWLTPETLENGAMAGNFFETYAARK